MIVNFIINFYKICSSKKYNVKYLSFYWNILNSIINFKNIFLIKFLINVLFEFEENESFIYIK